MPRLQAAQHGNADVAKPNKRPILDSPMTTEALYKMIGEDPANTLPQDNSQQHAGLQALQARQLQSAAVYEQQIHNSWIPVEFRYVMVNVIKYTCLHNQVNGMLWGLIDHWLWMHKIYQRQYQQMASLLGKCCLHVNMSTQWK
eukprot:jgi/Chrzof1/14652/Cz09g10250.t1